MECKGHEAKRICLGVKHTFTNGEEYNGWNTMTPKCTHTLGIAFVQELQIFIPLVEKGNKHQIRPQNTITPLERS